MKRLLCCTLVVLCASSLEALRVHGQPAETADLQAYQWSHRLLLVGARSETDQRYDALVSMLHQRAGELRDRQMLVWHLFETGVSRIGNTPLDPATASQLRQQLDMAPGQLTAVLIGKDGGEKWRQTNHIDLGAVFARIDQMPMRQQELRQRGR